MFESKNEYEATRTIRRWIVSVIRHRMKIFFKAISITFKWADDITEY